MHAVHLFVTVLWCIASGSATWTPAERNGRRLHMRTLAEEEEAEAFEPLDPGAEQESGLQRTTLPLLRQEPDSKQAPLTIGEELREAEALQQHLEELHKLVQSYEPGADVQQRPPRVKAEHPPARSLLSEDSPGLYPPYPSYPPPAPPSYPQPLPPYPPPGPGAPSPSPPSPYAPSSPSPPSPPSPYAPSAPYYPTSPYEPGYPDRPYAPEPPYSPPPIRYSPPPPPLVTYSPPPSPFPPPNVLYSPPPSPSPPPSVLYSPPPPDYSSTPPSAGCSSDAASHAAIFIVLELDYDEVEGNQGFKQSLLNRLGANFKRAFSDLLSHGCTDYVQVQLSPGSTVARVQVDMGAGSTPEDRQQLEDRVGRMSPADVERDLLTLDGEPLEVDGKKVEVINVSSTDPSSPDQDGGSGGDDDSAAKLGSCLSVRFLLVAAAAVAILL